MITIRKSLQRGHAHHGWLESYYTFSFADYYDPEYMGFRPLRVINEDKIQPGEGFGNHPHRDMEIITCVLSGALEHKDSMGNGSVISAGEVQVMSAGSGVTHSEFNHSQTEVAHILQIWILPATKGIKPNYQQKAFRPQDKKNKWCLLVSKAGRDGSLTIHQDVDLWASQLSKGQTLEHAFKPGRYGWLQLMNGSVSCQKDVLTAGDGAAISDERKILLTAKQDAEFLLFDMP